MKHNVHHYIKMAFGNRHYIENAEVCGCYYCNTLFNKEQVEFMEEKDGKYTALCPHCMIDSVIDDKRVAEGGEELTIELLEAVNKEAF